jgi:short-subunit dehydrogenase
VQLSGAVCLVTGASGGIGAETACLLARRGARVIACGRDHGRTAQAASRAGATPLVGSLAGPGRAAALAHDALAVHGRVDLLVNVAGVGWAGRLADMAEDAAREVIELDLTAPLLLTRALLPDMLARRRGHVVNVGSIVGLTGSREEAAYAAAKAGLAVLSESLRQECRGTGVGVTLVVPGVVDTGFFARRGSPYARRRPAPIPPRRVATALVRAVEHGRPEVVVPAWMSVASRVRGGAPELFRPLVDRFG